MGELTEGEDPQVLPMLTREDEQRGAVRQSAAQCAPHSAVQRALPSESAARHKRQRLQYLRRCRRARSDAVVRHRREFQLSAECAGFLSLWTVLGVLGGQFGFRGSRRVF